VILPLVLIEDFSDVGNAHFWYLCYKKMEIFLWSEAHNAIGFTKFVEFSNGGGLEPFCYRSDTIGYHQFVDFSNSWRMRAVLSEE
jgi:hypothetical protein